MKTSLKSDTCELIITPIPGWLKVGLVAAGSALAAGVAVALWYKETITQFQNAEEQNEILQYDIGYYDSFEDI